MSAEKSPSRDLSRAISVPAVLSPGVVSPANDRHSTYTASYDVAPVVSVYLAFKRVKLVVLAFVAIGVVAAAMLLFLGGVNLKTVEIATVQTDATQKEQEKLVDAYNSYTGNAAAALTKPIEVFATMALQLVLLRFAARAVLQPERAWRVDKLSAVAAWALLYLLLNGFNSLNVQLKPQRVIAIITASDLSLTDNSTTNGTETLLWMNTNASHVVRETIPGNLVTNTVLRTAVVPRDWARPSPQQCTNPADEIDLHDGVEFGFPIRSWLGRMLPSAPPTSSVTLSLTSNTTGNLDASTLPMDASRAAFVFLTGVTQAWAVMNWFDKGYFDKAPVVRKKKDLVVNQTYAFDDARLIGLLPPSPLDTEASERAWLLREAPRLLQYKFGTEKDGIGSSYVLNNDTDTGLSMSFSHVNLTSRIAFDAVTFEAAVNVDKYTTALDADGTTRYLNFNYQLSACGPPSTSLCMVQKAKYGVLNDGQYDVPSQVLAGGICVNANGSEAHMTFFSRDDAGKIGQGTRDCERQSNTSMLVISIAKRIVVDDVILKETARTKAVTPALKYPVLVNPRKIYTLTVGRLGWETEDLAAAFGAECRAGTCDGLMLPLTDGLTAVDPSAMLLASVDRLPVRSLGRIDRERNSQKKHLRLVVLHEPARPSAAEAFEGAYDKAAGDILFPHNVQSNQTFNVFAAVNRSDDTCPTKVENRLHQVLGNHIYMEDGLQPAYMSALFWLFQNGAVKAVVNTSASVASTRNGPATTLQFDGNIQVSALVASIPDINVWLSLAGCAVLVLGVLATASFSGQLIDSNEAPGDGNKTQLHHVASVSDPRVIAQVMLDESRFPPMFLDRKIVDTSGRVGITTMDSFQISSMTLEGEDGDGAKQVVLANQASSGEP